MKSDAVSFKLTVLQPDLAEGRGPSGGNEWPDRAFRPDARASRLQKLPFQKRVVAPSFVAACLI